MKLDYSDLIKRFELEKIVGIGLADPGAGKTLLTIWSGPLDNNGVSKQVMKGFEEMLLAEYKKICPSLQRIGNFCREK